VAALGAIMRFAVDASSDTFDVKMIGLILIIVGSVAFIVGLIKDFTARPASGQPPQPTFTPPPPPAPTGARPAAEVNPPPAK